MLLTTCHQCDARFRVATEQLNVRQGRVMCGRCRHVFNAFESLERFDDAQGDIPDVRPGAFHTDHAGQPGDSEHAAAPDIAPAAVPELTDVPIDSEASPANDAPHFVTATTAPSVLDAPVEPSPIPLNAPLALPPPAAPGGNRLLTAPAARQAVRARWWGLAAVPMALLLMAQLLYLFRSDIVQAYPATRPALARACEALRCQIHWGRDEAAMKIESSDLIEVPGRNGRLLLSTIVVNRAKTMQDYPVLEIRLTDTGNLLLASRLLTPAEYLGRAPASDEGVAVDAELFVNLHVDWKGKVTPSGYSIRVLYPV